MHLYYNLINSVCALLLALYFIAVSACHIKPDLWWSCERVFCGGETVVSVKKKLYRWIKNKLAKNQADEKKSDLCAHYRNQTNQPNSFGLLKCCSVKVKLTHIKIYLHLIMNFFTLFLLIIKFYNTSWYYSIVAVVHFFFIRR